MFRSNSSADPVLCRPLDSASASLQMLKSKLNSDTVLPQVVHPLSLKSRDFADVPTRVSSTQKRLSGFPAQIQCHAGSNTPTPVCVGRIIYDMLPCSPHHHQQLKSEKELDHQIIREGVVAEPQLQKEDKGTGREHSNPNTNTNSKHSTHETLNMVSSALATKVKHTLADPLLPGQHKRTIVLTTSESEYEHSDDGSWSSEEMGSEDEEVSFLLLRCIYMYGT
jgi:hypothetical protein